MNKEQLLAVIQVIVWAIVTVGAITTMTVDRYHGADAARDFGMVFERLEQIDRDCNGK